MQKRYINTAIIYAIIAMVFGVFYREFTKFNGFTGVTRLSVLHTHYFMLGMFFFLMLLILEKNFAFSEMKNVGKFVVTYQIGLNISGIGLFMRGLTQVIMPEISRGLDKSISGIAGIGHILLCVSMVLILLQVKKKVQ